MRASRARLSLFLAAGVCVGTQDGATAEVRPIMAQRSPPMAPMRDPNLAVAEELEAARRSGTVAAYDLFLARHPDHELAAVARQERKLLAEKAAPKSNQ